MAEMLKHAVCTLLEQQRKAEAHKEKEVERDEMETETKRDRGEVELVSSGDGELPSHSGINNTFRRFFDNTTWQEMVIAFTKKYPTMVDALASVVGAE
jgi:precorrin-3B methylase